MSNFTDETLRNGQMLSVIRQSTNKMAAEIDVAKITALTRNSLRLAHTQGNYVTQNSSGMCHLMPWLHLPEWREEDERAFVHCRSSGLNHAIITKFATELSKVSFITL